MQTKKRLRDYGLNPGILPTGLKNGITDVDGVMVGHHTIHDGNSIHTGVTIIDPGTEALFYQKLPAAVAVGNGYGKMAGITQIQELGTLETPIAFTNTLAVGPVMRGLVNLTLKNHSDIPAGDSINAIVGETNDGFLNDLHADILTSDHVMLAYNNRSQAVQEGCIGAGTGTRAFNWKGGIGTSSRKVMVNGQEYTIGSLVQTNYGGALTIMGVPIGTLLQKEEFSQWTPMVGDGSCMIAIATDAPLSSRQLGRIARRSFLALGKTGSVMAHGSGDYAIAFSTNRAGVEGSNLALNLLSDEYLTGFFLGAIEAVEESVYNALFLAETTVGRNGNTLEKLPVTDVVNLLEKYANR